MKIIVTPSEIVNSDLWQLFPAIECSKVKDIPCDYPGAIGVPITALDKIGKNDGHSGFQILDNAIPRVNGKECYRRLIIRNLNPKLPNEVELLELLEKSGVKPKIIIALDWSEEND